MKDLGGPKSFLEMEIKRNSEERQITINQPKYIKSMFNKFDMTECNPQITTMVTRQVRTDTNRSKRKKTCGRNR